MHWLTKYTAGNAHLYSLNSLKTGSRSPSSDQIVIFTPMIQYMKFSLNPFCSRDRVQTSFCWSKFNIQSADVTLKMRPRSPRSNYFFALSYWCFCATKSIYWFRRQSANKAHLYRVQTRLIFYSLYSVMTLQTRSRSPKSNQIF